MPAPIKCPACTTIIPHPSIRSDAERSFPLAGEQREGQNVVACMCCGQLLHTGCVREASTLVSWKHLWFSNPGMRALIEERRLFGLEVAFCQRCRDDLLEQILGNYRALLEGARFLDDLGRGTFLGGVSGRGAPRCTSLRDCSGELYIQPRHMTTPATLTGLTSQIPVILIGSWDMLSWA